MPTVPGQVFSGDQISADDRFLLRLHDLLAYDIAICLNAWCFEQPTRSTYQGRALLRAYGSRGRLAMPNLRPADSGRGAALRFLSPPYDWFNTEENAMVKPKDPLEYRRTCVPSAGQSRQYYGLDHG